MNEQPTVSNLLKAVESAVVDSEWQLARQEALLIRLKLQKRDTSEASLALESMLKAQQLRQSERLRLLSLLKPKECKPRHEAKR